jgi:hypothetical protein
MHDRQMPATATHTAVVGLGAPVLYGATNKFSNGLFKGVLMPCAASLGAVSGSAADSSSGAALVVAACPRTPQR